MLVVKFSTFINNHLYNFGITKTKYLEHNQIVWTLKYAHERFHCDSNASRLFFSSDKIFMIFF